MAERDSGSSRARQRSRQQRVADRLGIDADQVAVRDTLDRGTDANLTSRGATAAEQQARQEFASEADFVNKQDVAAEADRQNPSVSARIAEGRRDDIEQRAEREIAEGQQFVSDSDVDADVGQRGVTDVGIPDPRQDDVASRARKAILSDVAGPAKASDVAVEVSAQGVQKAQLKDGAERDIATRKIDEQFESVDVSEADIRDTGDSFAPTDELLKQAAAAQTTEFDADPGDFEVVEQEQSSSEPIEPDTDDLRRYTTRVFGEERDQLVDKFVDNTDDPNTDGSISLPANVDSELTNKAIALREAVRNNEQIDPSRFEGIGTTTSRSTQLTDSAEKQAAAVEIDDQFDQIDVDAADVVETDDGFGPDANILKRSAARQTDPITNPVAGDLARFVASQDQNVSADQVGINNLIRDPNERDEAGMIPAVVRDEGTQTVERFRDIRNAIENDETINPERFAGVEADESTGIGDFEVVSTDSGRETRLRDAAQRERAQVTFDAQLDEVDVSDSDIVSTEGGVRVRTSTQKEAAAERAEKQTAAVDEFDVSDISQFDGGFGVNQQGQREVAASTFDREFESTTITTDDVTPAGDGFGLGGSAQREIAADRLEEQTPIEQIDPENDLEQQPDGDGFALAGGAQREFAASQFEEQTALDEINPNTGLTRTDSGFGLSTIGQRELAADRFEQETELEEVDPQQDILLNEDGSAALAGRTETRLAAELLDEQVDADVGVDDIERVTNPDGDTKFEFEGVR